MTAKESVIDYIDSVLVLARQAKAKCLRKNPNVKEIVDRLEGISDDVEKALALIDYDYDADEE